MRSHILFLIAVAAMLGIPVARYALNSDTLVSGLAFTAFMCGMLYVAGGARRRLP